MAALWCSGCTTATAILLQARTCLHTAPHVVLRPLLLEPLVGRPATLSRSSPPSLTSAAAGRLRLHVLEAMSFAFGVRPLRLQGCTTRQPLEPYLCRARTGLGDKWQQQRHSESSSLWAQVVTHRFEPGSSPNLICTVAARLECALQLQSLQVPRVGALAAAPMLAARMLPRLARAALLARICPTALRRRQQRAPLCEGLRAQRVLYCTMELPRDAPLRVVPACAPAPHCTQRVGRRTGRR